MPSGLAIGIVVSVVSYGRHTNDVLSPATPQVHAT